MKGTIITKRKLDAAGEWVYADVYLLDGREVGKAEFDRAMRGQMPKVKVQHVIRPRLKRAWPLYSEAAAVHPDQIPEAVEVARRKGVPTDFLSDGRVVFTGRGHRAAYLRAHGMFDKDAGYGDPARS